MRPHTPEATHLIWVIWEPFGFVFMLVHSPWHIFLTEGIKWIDWEINHLWNKSEQKSGLSVPPVKGEKYSGEDGSWESWERCFSHLHFRWNKVKGSELNVFSLLLWIPCLRFYMVLVCTGISSILSQGQREFWSFVWYFGVVDMTSFPGTHLLCTHVQGQGQN